MQLKKKNQHKYRVQCNIAELLYLDGSDDEDLLLINRIVISIKVK